MTGPPVSPLRLRVAQTAPRRADPEHNRSVMETAARSAADDVDLLVFPELSLTGYDVGGRAHDLALSLDTGPAGSPGPGLELPADGPVVVHGLVERGDDHLLYNAAVVARGPELLHVHRKVHLPTYGTFDEGRIFAAGRRGPRVVRTPGGWRLGVLVCEELWHPAMAYLAALRGADLLVVLAAAVGRGVPDGLPEEEGRFASTSTWELLARTAAAVHGMWVVLANRSGVEGSLTFAGGSLVVDPGGEVVDRAADDAPDVLDRTLDHGAVTRARGAFSHARDEDAAWTARELDRVVRDDRNDRNDRGDRNDRDDENDRTDRTDR